MVKEKPPLDGGTGKIGALRLYATGYDMGVLIMIQLFTQQVQFKKGTQIGQNPAEPCLKVTP